MRGLMPPVLWAQVTCITEKNPFMDMNAAGVTVAQVGTSPLFLPSSLFCLFLFGRKGVLKRERPNEFDALPNAEKTICFTKLWADFPHEHIFYLYCAFPCDGNVTEKVFT